MRTTPAAARNLRAAARAGLPPRSPPRSPARGVGNFPPLRPGLSPRPFGRSALNFPFFLSPPSLPFWNPFLPFAPRPPSPPVFFFVIFFPMVSNLSTASKNRAHRVVGRQSSHSLASSPHRRLIPRAARPPPPIVFPSSSLPVPRVPQFHRSRLISRQIHASSRRDRRSIRPTTVSRPRRLARRLLPRSRDAIERAIFLIVTHCSTIDRSRDRRPRGTARAPPRSRSPSDR